MPGVDVSCPYSLNLILQSVNVLEDNRLVCRQPGLLSLVLIVLALEAEDHGVQRLLGQVSVDRCHGLFKADLLGQRVGYLVPDGFVNLELLL